MSKSTFPHWIYDNSEIPDPFGYGQDAVDFINSLKHPAAGSPDNGFQLFDWQERIVRKIYGPCDEDGQRIVREVFFFIPRGNRKTSLAAVLALLHLFGPEAVPNGQIIFAASDRAQAGIGFTESVGIIEMDKRLKRAVKIYNPNNSVRSIVSKIDGSTLKAVSSDGKAQHGSTPTFVLADEIHTWHGYELWEALQSGMAKRTGGLTVVATTAGRGSEGLAAERYKVAHDVATGKVIKPSFLPIMFEIQPDEDWQSEEVWHRVNPGLKHGFHDIKKLRSDAEEAKHNPRKANEFQQYQLNKWHGNSRDPLFDMATYDQGINPHFDLADLESLPCYLGVDMSVNGDLTAIVAAWRHDDGRVSIHPWFFVPDEDLQARSERDRVPYVQWRDDGLINTVSGAVIEPQAVEDHIRELCARFDVQEIAFDPHLARQSMQRLLDDGLPVIEFRQAPLTMAPAIGTLERVVNGRNIRHSGHPILRHHFDSVVASRSDMGLVRMHKGQKTDRIDGAVAAAMAVSRAAAGDSYSSFLDSDDFQEMNFYE